MCSSLAHQTIEIAQTSYEHRIALKLADSTEGCAELDILIGGDYYWDFLVERLYEGQGGPVAMETLFGWVLSGSVDESNHISCTNLISSSHVMKLGCDFVEPVNFDKEVIGKVGEFWDMENIGLHDADSIVCERV